MLPVPSIYSSAAHGSEVSPAARNTLDSARIPRASKLLICGLFQKVRVLAQDGKRDGSNEGGLADSGRDGVNNVGIVGVNKHKLLNINSL